MLDADPDPAELLAAVARMVRRINPGATRIRVCWSNGAGHPGELPVPVPVPSRPSPVVTPPVSVTSPPANWREPSQTMLDILCVIATRMEPGERYTADDIFRLAGCAKSGKRCAFLADLVRVGLLEAISGGGGGYRLPDRGERSGKGRGNDGE